MLTLIFVYTSCLGLGCIEVKKKVQFLEKTRGSCRIRILWGFWVSIYAGFSEENVCRAFRVNLPRTLIIEFSPCVHPN